MRLAKIFAFALSFLILCFPTAAMARMPATANLLDEIEKSIPVQNGEFSVNMKAPVPSSTIRSAIVSLPPGETGRVNKIVITGPNEQREYGCQNITVQNGTDLIKACGGPAVLLAGETIYQAEGSDFSPNPNVQFSVTLTSKFSQT